MSVPSFQQEEVDLQRALVDVVRVGASGNSAGVRQLAQRLIRRVPAGVRNEQDFREALASALATGLRDAPGIPSVLRSAVPEELPIDSDSSMPVALLETSVGVLRPVLNPRVQSQVDSIVAERRDHEKLAKVGLRPTATVLVSGPPGVGKTMCARYLAAELGVPLLTVDLASVMSSYLGKTGQNLRAALDFGRTRECLLFLDEFDALAKRRDDESDIGELKRIVNVLLLELERWPSTSLLVAATNHPQLLDRAVSRRFDALIEIDLPGFAERLDIVHQILDMKGLEEAPSAAEIAALCTDGCSGSELTRIIDTALRRSALTDEPLLDSTVRALLEHYPVSQTSEARDKLCLLAADRLHWSNRRIANFLGVSHPTVAKILQRVRGDRNGH